MGVKVFSINTTAGVRYGLVNAITGDVLYYAWARWKTAKGAEGHARKMGYELVK